MKIKKLLRKKYKKIKKLFKKKTSILESVFRLSLFALASLALWLTILEWISDNLFELIMINPDMTIITKIQDSAFFFFL